MMLDLLAFEFMRNALIAGLLASIACGLVGSLVVVNRIVFITGGIAHTAYGGVGLALLAGFSPVYGAAGASVLAALIMAPVTYRQRQRADTVIGVLWATGMALGVIFADLAPGYNVDLMGYLFGSILTVPVSDLWLMAGLDVVIAGFVLFFYKELVALSFDEEFAMVMGVRTFALYTLMLVMAAFTVIMLIRIVGLILVIALVSIPPFISERFSRSLGRMMITSVLFCAVFTVAGLLGAYRFNLTSGPAIILAAAAAFFLLAPFLHRR